MNKFLLRSVLTFSLALAPVGALAALDDPPEPPGGWLTGFGSVVELFDRASSWLFWILIMLSVIFVLVAAYKYLTSAGDPNKVSEASKTIVYAAVAIAIAFIAIGFPSLIADLIGVEGFP